MFSKLRKVLGQVNTIGMVVVGVLTIVVITNLIPVMTGSILAGKNALGNVNSVNNATSQTVNTTLDTILPTYAITPLAVVVGIILVALAYAGTRQ